MCPESESHFLITWSNMPHFNRLNISTAFLNYACMTCLTRYIWMGNRFNNHPRSCNLIGFTIECESFLSPNIESSFGTKWRQSTFLNHHNIVYRTMIMTFDLEPKIVIWSFSVIVLMIMKFRRNLPPIAGVPPS